MFDIGEIVGRIVLLDDFTPVLNTAATRLDSAALAAQRVGRRFEEAGRLVTIGFTVPVTAAATAAIAMSNKFESTIVKLTTISNVGAHEMEMMRDAALKLGPAVGQGPQAMADALVVITSTGFSGATALSILERSAKAAAIGLGETKDIARAVTSAMRAYGEDVLDAERATDILLTTVRKGGAEANEVAESLGRVVGIAAKVGVSFEELGAFVATFTRLGIDADEAVTALRGTLSVLLKPAAQTREMLASINMPIEELRKNVKERGLTEALIALIQATKGNEDAIGRIIPNVRALAGVLGTAGVQAEGLRENLKANLESVGELDKAFETASKTGAFKWASVVGRLKAEMIELGDTLVQAGVLDTAINLFDKFLDIVNDTVEAFGRLSKPTQEVVLSITAIVIVLGPLMRIIGTVTRVIGYFTSAIAWVVDSAAITGLVTWLGKAATAMGTFLIESEAVGAFLSTLASGPLAAIAAAGGAFVLVIRAITGSWDFILEPLKAGWSILKDISLIFYDLAVIAGKEVLDFLSKAYDYTVSWIPELKNLVTAFMDWVDPLNLAQIALALIRGHIEWMIRNAKITAQVIGGIAAATGVGSGRVPQLPEVPSSPLAGLLAPPELPPLFTGKIPLPPSLRTDSNADILDPAAAKAALKAAQELQEAFDRVNGITVTLTESQKENVVWLLKRKVTESDVAKVLNLTASQIKLVVEEEKFLAETRKLADKQALEHMEAQIKKAEGLAKAVVANLTVQKKMEADTDRMRRQMTMSHYDFQRSEIDKWEQDQIAQLDKTVDNWGMAADAIVANAKVQYEQLARESSTATFQMAVDAVKVETAWTEVFGNIPGIVRDAFTGGGGISGAMDAIVSSMGTALGRNFAKSDLGVKIFGGIADGIGKIAGFEKGAAFASMAGELSAALGSMLGPLIDTTLGDGILGTAAKWAMAGAVAGPWGALAGAIAGAVVGAFNKAQNLTAKSREEFAQSLSFSTLGDLYKDLGGLGKAGQTLADIGLNVVGRKDEAANKKWMADVQAFYDKLTEQVEKFINRTDVLWNKQIRDFARNTPVFGEILKQQLSSAATGLTDFLSAGAGALKSATDIRKEMKDIDEQRRELFEKGVFQGEEVDELDKKWDELNKTLKEQEGIWESLGITSQLSAEAFGAAIAGIFGELLSKGVPILDIIKQLSPAVDAFRQQLVAAGLDGGAAFNAIEGMFTIAADKVAGPVLQAVQSLGGALVNLNNSGLLTQDMFLGLTGQIGQAHGKLLELGFDGDQVLRLMQPSLQTIWELQTDFGFATDEATQALVNQAREAGLVGDKFRDPMERMIMAMEKVVTILERIALKLGALPGVADDAATGIDNAFSRGTDFEVRIRYRDGDMPRVRDDSAVAGTTERFVAENPEFVGSNVETIPPTTIIIQALDSQTAAEWLTRGNNARTIAEGVVPLIPRVVEYFGEA